MSAKSATLVRHLTLPMHRPPAPAFVGLAVTFRPEMGFGNTEPGAWPVFAAVLWTLGELAASRNAGTPLGVRRCRQRLPLPRAFLPRARPVGPWRRRPNSLRHQFPAQAGYWPATVTLWCVRQLSHLPCKGDPSDAWFKVTGG
ncbi:hypothetical protein HRbin30_02265 [bacterium HR30]|nr:hypothetical protein HRbin30_02265 [bacterium HR30]